MGQEIKKPKFEKNDFSIFRQRLDKETQKLDSYFKESLFTDDGYVGGLELEAWIIDDEMTPAPFNNIFLELMNSEKVVPELALFNFEINVDPQPLSGHGIRQLQSELQETWHRCRQTAVNMGGDVIAIGVLPSLSDEHLKLSSMTPSHRYQALNDQVLSLRGHTPITLDITGNDHLNTTHHDVMLESAATSFQIHLQFPPEMGVRFYNAALIASAPLLALSANSPFVFGQNLWDESRIPLFEQSIDDGTGIRRVDFGVDYVHNSLHRCFKENLLHYPVLLPELFDHTPEHLSHLRLHNGTVWRWNRPLIGFNSDNRPHLRIENRVVPAGPTLDDTLANAAFFWGLCYSLAHQQPAPESLLDFSAARQNFYQAARHSLYANLDWLDGERHEVRSLLTNTLLPMVESGLQALGVDSHDAAHYLGILQGRTEKRQNGARWQKDWVSQYGPDMMSLTQVYHELQNQGDPVHQWEL